MRQLKVEVWGGRDLLAVDRRLFGKDSCDPFLKLAFGDLELKSRVLKDSLSPGRPGSPVFNQAFFLPVAEPSFLTHLSLQLLDFEKLGRHQPLGSSRVPLRHVADGHFRDPHWQHFYGAPLGATSAAAKEKMSLFSDLGTRG